MAEWKMQSRYRRFGRIPFLLMGVVAGTFAQNVPSATSSAPSGTSEPLAIQGLAQTREGASIGCKDPHHCVDSGVGLNTSLWVLLNHLPADNAGAYVLLLNDQEMYGLDPPIVTSVGSSPALRFILKRSSTPSSNLPVWNDILGSPWGSHVPVTVTIASKFGAVPAERVSGISGATSFRLQVYTLTQAGVVALVTVVVLLLVFGQARNHTTLRDNLLPQLPAAQQTYSLGRCQMAFWFVIIFLAYIVLLVLLQDTNTLTSQALLLMGVSAVTAGASIAVDVAKTSPADAVNVALQALGIKTYDDVRRLQLEIADREAELNPPAKPGQTPQPAAGARRAQLLIEINDRESILRTYQAKVRPFVSQGWFKDVTTDMNGPTVHRLQAVFWTCTLGSVFIYSVYRNLAMPEYNGMLLALMGISSAGYVGFKYQEVNS